MKTVPKSAFWIIFTVVFIDLIGFGIVFPLLPLYTRTLHLTGFETGLILGVYSLMQFIFAPILGAWSDKVGRRPVLLISMLGTAASFFMLVFAKTFWWLLIARALDGIAGSNISTAQAYIADISPPEQRTRNLGMWIGAAFGLGFAFGPFLGGAFHYIGQQWLPNIALGFPFLAAGILATLNVLYAYFKLPESRDFSEKNHAVGRRTASWQAIYHRLKDAPGLLIISYAVVILAFSQMEATFTWLSRDLFHLSPLMIYALFGYLGVVMALVQGGLVRRLAPKLGDQKLALLGCVLMMVSLAAMPFLTSLVGLLLTSGMLAVGESFSNPALISSISKGSSEALQGEAMGVTQSLASLSRFVGPATAGLLYQHYGVTTPYLFSALVILVTLIMLQAGFKRLVLFSAPQSAMATQ